MVIRVSRHGMTRCTTCDRHIRVAAAAAETRCPFCGGALTALPPGSAGRLGYLGRSGGALAASLMSFGLGAACLDEGQGQRDVSDAVDASDLADTVDLDSSQPLYGLPMDTTAETTDDTGPQPLYGLPMDVTTPDTAEDTSGSDDVPIQPLYGAPPDVFEVAEDSTPQPEYGLPMEDVDDGPDAADDASDATDDTDGNVPVPLYGQPPG